MVVPFALVVCDVDSQSSRSGDREPMASTEYTLEEGNEEQQRIDINPVPLERLIGTAGLIVIGAVEDVYEDRFIFHIEEDLSHQDVSGAILVSQPALPEFFEPRITPFTMGQRFILFLNKPEGSAYDQPWDILGSPIAGELPVDEDHAYFESYDLRGFEFSERQVHGIVRPMQRFDLNDFKDAVRGYRVCFAWSLEQRIKNEKVRTRWVPSRVCDETTMRDFQEKSRIHEYLARTTLQQIPESSE